MKSLYRLPLIALCLAGLFSTLSAQQVKRTDFDVTKYVIDAQLAPEDNKLSATADVTFAMLEDARNVSFELNGSLKVDTITRITAASTTPLPAAVRPARTPVAAAAAPGGITFVQDQVGVSDLGPSVRIDFGDTVAKGTQVTLRFKYSGVLNTASGGPLLSKRLAYVGEDQGYLMYAARWFPFHDYAADMAAADITITVPGGMQIVGFSDSPVTSAGGKFRFTQQKPGLVGNFAYGKFNPRTLKIGEYEIQFNTRPGFDSLVQDYGETLGKALDFYSKKFGNADFGKKLVVAQIDDESLDFYSSMGMLFVSSRQFEQERGVTEERLQREAAFQWWGLTVGLKSFDDAWLS